MFKLNKQHQEQVIIIVSMGRPSISGFFGHPAWMNWGVWGQWETVSKTKVEIQRDLGLTSSLCTHTHTNTRKCTHVHTQVLSKHWYAKGFICLELRSIPGNLELERGWDRKNEWMFSVPHSIVCWKTLFPADSCETYKGEGLASSSPSLFWSL